MVFRSTSWFPPCFPTFIPSGNWISRLGSTVLRRRNFLFIFGGKCQSHYKGWNQVVFRFFLHYRLPCNYETMSSIKMVSVYYVVANHCTMQRKSRPWLNGPWRKASLLKPNSHQQNGSSANVLLINANGSMVREYYIEQKSKGFLTLHFRAKDDQNFIFKLCARRWQRCHHSGIRINFFNIALLSSSIFEMFLERELHLTRILSLEIFFSEMLEFFSCLVGVIWCTR